MKKITIKDELYGAISLTELEKRIIDSPDFQRLRRIKQMVLTNLVYPCATHTRFEHSLGTMHVASLMADQLELENDSKEKVRLYALLHDIGHTAFSHEGERVLSKFLGSHEEIGKKKILHGEIGEIISENYSPQEIVKLEKTKEGQIVNSDIGSDRIDYLRRDAQNTGVAYGVIDSDRIIHTIEFLDDELVINEGGLIAAESLLIARFMMFSSVYFHHTVRIAGAMLCKAIELAIKNKVMTPTEFLELGDEEAFLQLKKDKDAAYYIDRILKRKLFKEAYSIENGVIKEQDLEEIEARLSKKFNSRILIDLPSEFFKPVSIKVKINDQKKTLDLIEISELVKSLKISEEKRKRILILCPEEKRESVKKALENRKEREELGLY